VSTAKPYDPKNIDNYGYEFDASRIRRFLWFCAGADVELLKRCPQSEHIKEEGIGGIVLATGGLAFISGSYAFYTVFSNHRVLGGNEPIDITAAFFSIVLGFLWALVIFNLDRFIVSSVSHGDGSSKITWDEFKGAIPRLFMALIIGLCLSTPLEIRVMKSEIEAQLYKDQIKFQEEEYPKLAKKIAEKKSVVESRRGEVKKKLDELLAEITDKEKRIAVQDKVMNDEGAGNRGPGGIGPQYRAAKELREKLEKEKMVLESRYKDEKPRLDEEIKRFDAELDQLSEEEKKEREAIIEQSRSLNGLVKRITVAHEKYPIPSALLSLLLIIIEVAPIFFKMMLEKGPYELLVENQKRITQAKHAIESQIHITTESGSINVVGETFHQADLISSFEVGNLNVERALTQRIQENYERDTIADIDRNPSDYVKKADTDERS
jgi:hypothetical protein